jgi:iron complex transport system ATP-binding protein
MNDILIDVRNLSFHFGTRRVLNGVNFEVKRGESLAIVGPNGAGKSTLLKCLGRLLKGSPRSICLEGKPLESYRQKDLARWMSYVPQAEGRGAPFTVREFILMGRYPHLSPFSLIGVRDREAADRAMEWTGTRAFSNRPLDSLSGGERQKVLIAAALAQEARILLLDEPTTFLDYKHQSEIESILWKVKRDSGTTLILVTHDINAASLLGDRILALRAGEAVFLGPPEKAMRDEVLRTIYGKSFLFATHPETGLPVVVSERVNR